MNDHVRQLATEVHRRAAEPLPDAVREAARRTLLNVLGTSAGAAAQQAVALTATALTSYAPEDPCVAPGRPEPLGPLDAALCTGLAAHLDDFDDTHLRTVIHPGAVCLSALVALQREVADADAEHVLAAVAWGVEVQLRLGNAVSPEHYDAGWHITGTCGAVGAAVTAGLLLGLDADRLDVALGWAIERGLGNREGFGSMTKPFHPGRAAVGGVLAVLDARSGAAAPGDSLQGPAGLATRLADGVLRPDELLADLGSRWELRTNTFKPYPCGIVTHPAIEVAEGLHEQLVAAGGLPAVARVTLRCHPLVPELTGNLTPVDGLQARFSTAHGVAAGLLTGRVDLRSYDDEFVTSPDAVAARALVDLVADAAVDRDAALLLVELEDGSSLEAEVVHARGSLLAPLDDVDLEQKVAGLVDGVLEGGGRSLGSAVAATGGGYLAGLLRATRPATQPGPPEAAAAPTTSAGSEHLDGALAAVVAGGRASSTTDDDRRAEARDALALAREAVDGDGDAPSTDPRARARHAVRLLAAKGVPPLLAASASARVGAAGPERDDLSDEDAVVLGWSLGRATARVLEVDETSTALLTAAVGALAGRAGADTALHGLALAATQTTGVSGDVASPGVAALRLERLVSAGVEAAILAAAGFTGPARPFTGRRGLFTLLSRDAPSTVEELAAR